MLEIRRLTTQTNSIAVSTAISALAAILVIITSVATSVYHMDELVAQEQGETLRHVLQQHGTALSRELKVQTIWTEGYSNSTNRNTEWMNEFYGPYLDRLLGYKQLYILDSANKAVYSYVNGSSEKPATYSTVESGLSDLIDRVRAPAKSGNVEESELDLGAGQTVLHRSASDVRLLAGHPFMVIVSTILPDTPQETPIANPPFLMVAAHPVDDTLLKKLGAHFGFENLMWSSGGAAKELSAFEVRSSNGNVVGSLSWRAERPGLKLAKSIAPGLILALVFLIALATLLVRRNYAQAKSLERYSHTLGKINDELEERVSARTQELEATFENIAQGILLLNEDGTIAISNHQAIELMEVPSVEDLNAEILAMRSEMADSHNPDRRTLPSATIRQDLKRGSARFVEVRQKQLAQGGVVVTISDVSALKVRQKELEDATLLAKEANEAKTRFLSTMSHEMRTPLNGIIGALDLINRTTLSDEQLQLVRIADQSSDALLVHINDVLDFSKLEAGKLELDQEPFNLAKLVYGVRDIIRPMAEHRHNKLVIEYGSEVPRSIVGDRVRVRQIVLNLVSNANKFTKNGVITVAVRSENPAPNGTCMIEISVSDTGIGIRADRIENLFCEFSMLESEYKRTSGGTGLGLAISKRLVTQMGGKIGVRSTEGKGSTFHVCAPFLISPEDAAGSEPTLADPDEHCQPLKILLVDDNSTNRLIGSRLLQSIGHRVTTASNGRQGVQLATDTLYDVILMDISMPDIDGCEATRLIRQLPEPFGSVWIIALTANAVIGDRENFFAAGMNDYLSKPFRTADIQAKLLKRNIQSSSGAPGGFGSDGNSRVTAEHPLLDEVLLAELQDEVSRETVMSILSEYLSEMAGRRSEMSAAISNHSDTSVRALCHAIAGSSGSVGATRVSKLAKKIEMAPSTNRDHQSSECDILLELLSETELAVQRYLDRDLSSAAA